MLHGLALFSTSIFAVTTGIFRVLSASPAASVSIFLFFFCFVVSYLYIYVCLVWAAFPKAVLFTVYLFWSSLLNRSVSGVAIAAVILVAEMWMFGPKSWTQGSQKRRSARTATAQRRRADY